jgi:hypothetical protein
MFSDISDAVSKVYDRYEDLLQSNTEMENRLEGAIVDIQTKLDELAERESRTETTTEGWLRDAVRKCWMKMSINSSADAAGWYMIRDWLEPQKEKKG